MEIEIISKEIIKPSSPTPPHLKTFNLSLLDQMVLYPYIPLILYYPNHNENNILQPLERSIVLKKSLSKTLTQFYPLAGTISQNDLSIDCNDVGACYVLALVRCRLNDFLTHSDQQSINRFLPFEPRLDSPSVGARVTNIQVNIFECGGIAIGLCISHKILDGHSLCTFLKAWANMACGDTNVFYPNLNASSIFQGQSLWFKNSLIALYGSFLKQGKCSTKRFVFNGDSLAKLKTMATSNGVEQPTRVEVVSALIWKCAMASSKQNHGLEKPSCLTHVVNLRRKLSETLSKDLIGNVICLATAMFRPNYETTFYSLVTKVRESFSKIDIKFVNKLQGDERYVALHETLKEMGEFSSLATTDIYTFTSWCNMGFYEIDFGWGNPSWVTGIVSDGSSIFMNVVNLIDTKGGEGIEAWISLDEEEMKSLQNNPELLAFASLDPSPI